MWKCAKGKIGIGIPNWNKRKISRKYWKSNPTKVKKWKSRQHIAASMRAKSTHAYFIFLCTLDIEWVSENVLLLNERTHHQIDSRSVGKDHVINTFCWFVYFEGEPLPCGSRVHLLLLTMWLCTCSFEITLQKVSREGIYLPLFATYPLLIRNAVTE